MNIGSCTVHSEWKPLLRFCSEEVKLSQDVAHQLRTASKYLGTCLPKWWLYYWQLVFLVGLVQNHHLCFLICISQTGWEDRTNSSLEQTRISWVLLKALKECSCLYCTSSQQVSRFVHILLGLDMLESNSPRSGRLRAFLSTVNAKTLRKESFGSG